MRHTGNRIEGSNPSLSAIPKKLLFEINELKILDLGTHESSHKLARAHGHASLPPWVRFALAAGEHDAELQAVAMLKG
jgi:hypothetical protein